MAAEATCASCGRSVALGDIRIRTISTLGRVTLYHGDECGDVMLHGLAPEPPRTVQTQVNVNALLMDYELQLIRWAMTQSKTLEIADLARLLGLNVTTFRQRLRQGLGEGGRALHRQIVAERAARHVRQYAAETTTTH